MFRTQIAVVVAAVLLTGCSFDEGSTYVEEPASLYSRLGVRENLVLEPTSLVGVAAIDNDGNALPCLQPSVVGGTVILRATNSGLLLVEKLEIELSDVTIQAGVIYGEPIHLTDMRFQLGTQIAIESEWNPTRVDGAGVADLLLDWAVLDDSGQVYPLATQRIRDAEFMVSVGLDEFDNVTASVTTAIAGHIGSFANRIELADFSMAVTAITAEPVQ
jgi:hypothetical protein